MYVPKKNPSSYLILASSLSFLAYNRARLAQSRASASMTYASDFNVCALLAMSYAFSAAHRAARLFVSPMESLEGMMGSSVSSSACRVT